jgi:hypothetical protein
MNVRLRIASIVGETLFPPRAPFFSDAGNLPVPRTPPPHRPEVVA